MPDRPTAKFKLVYSPEEGEPQEFPFDLMGLNSLDAEDLGPWENYGEFGARLVTGHRRATRAMFWVLRRQTEPGLQFDDVNVSVSDLILHSIDDDDPAEPEGNDEPGDGPTDSP